MHQHYSFDYKRILIVLHVGCTYILCYISLSQTFELHSWKPLVEEHKHYKMNQGIGLDLQTWTVSTLMAPLLPK
jgi:hypothetical protein